MEVNRQGYSFKTVENKTWLWIGTYDDGVELTEWLDLAKDSRLAEVDTILLFANSGLETTKVWCEKALTSLGSLKHIKHFYMTRTWANAPENSPSVIEDTGQFFEVLPNLQSIHLEYVKFKNPPSFKQPNLKKFSWISPIPQSYEVSGVIQSIGKNIEVLQLDFCGGGVFYDAEWAKSDFKILFDNGFPKLKKLALIGIQSAELIDTLLKSPLIKSLETLDLTCNSLSETRTQYLIKNATQFSHLKKMVVSECEEDENQEDVDPELFVQLAAAYPKGNLEIVMGGTWSSFTVQLDT